MPHRRDVVAHRGPTGRFRLQALAALFAVSTLSCAYSENTELFPKSPHWLVPTLPRETTQLGNGAVTGEAPEQPIAFPHDRHVQNDGIQCEYCHNAARNSIHAGAPDAQTCMGCHRYVKRASGQSEDSPEIARVVAQFEKGEPMPWKKVHDLPDFVYFSHMRHVRAGVQCTECHGQVQTMSGERITVADGTAAEHGGEAATGEQGAASGAHGSTAGAATEATTKVINTMTRESTLQMGWCITCHETHPSVDKNYGEAAHLRRAELKDCWTCHK